MSLRTEWDRCEPWLIDALDRSPPTHTIDDVRTAVMRGEAKLWAGRNAAAVTQIEVHPQLKALSVWLAGGDLEELRDEMLPQAEVFAREQGCRYVAVTGRQGWARALGYRPLHWTCAKELI